MYYPGHCSWSASTRKATTPLVTVPGGPHEERKKGGEAREGRRCKGVGTLIGWVSARKAIPPLDTVLRKGRSRLRLRCV